MSVVVTKSLPVAVVGLSEPTGGTINLSSFDNCYPPIPVTMLLVFDQPIRDPVETIKKALSQALVHYHPLAGRLVHAHGQPVHISCTGEGVSLVGASASCALDKITTSPLLLLGDLAVPYPVSYCRPGDALLLMQVTEFACGGFAVGVTWNHLAADSLTADGAGMAQFLQAVGELARGMPAPSVVPLRSYPLPCLPPPVVAAMRSQMTVAAEEMASLDVTVPSRLISCIKAECGSECTEFDAVAAVLWQCRARAVISDPNAPMSLVFPSSLRGLVGAKHGYYGNGVMVQQVLAKSGTVASGDVKDLVKLIRLAKERIPDILTNGDGSCDQETPSRYKYNTLVVLSWRNLGLDAVDFGCGSPARVMPPLCKLKAAPTPLSICVLCPPCKGKDGVNVVSLCVKPEHADAFVRELATLDVY